MADFVFNIAKGAVAQKIRAGANLAIMILSATGIETDAVLRDKDTITDLVSGATDEVTNSGYSRKTISNASVTLTVDDTNDRVDVDIPDQTFSAIAAGSNWSDAVVYEDTGGADSSRVPLTQHDFAVTPDGTDITLQVASAGFFRAS